MRSELFELSNILGIFQSLYLTAGTSRGRSNPQVDLSSVVVTIVVVDDPDLVDTA